MMNDKAQHAHHQLRRGHLQLGFWETVLPLPDCPAGTRAMIMGADIWAFKDNRGYTLTFSTADMRRNPANFRWVPEPEHQCPQISSDGGADGSKP